MLTMYMHKCANYARKLGTSMILHNYPIVSNTGMPPYVIYSGIFTTKVSHITLTNIIEHVFPDYIVEYDTYGNTIYTFHCNETKNDVLVEYALVFNEWLNSFVIVDLNFTHR